MSDEVVQGTGAYLTLAVESLGSQLTAAEATMREVAKELRARAYPENEVDPAVFPDVLRAMANRLDPPPVVENPPA